MSDAASTDGAEPLSPVVRAAARGVLPEWSRVSDARRAHMARVADAARRVGGRAGSVGAASASAGSPSAGSTMRCGRRIRSCCGTQVPTGDARPRRSGAPRSRGGRAAPRPAGRARAGRDPLPHHRTPPTGSSRDGPSTSPTSSSRGATSLSEWRAGLRARMPHEMDEVLVEVLASRLRPPGGRPPPAPPGDRAFWSALVGPGR